MSERQSETKVPTKSAFYSRSTLAQHLGISLKKLTQILLDAGWLRSDDGQIRLSGKGEFEGGYYRQSQKYGEYIVWPESVLQHSLFRQSESPLLSATDIARQFQIKARQVNAWLAEQGLIVHHVSGWHLTDFGRWAGGNLQHHERTGAAYVLWQPDLLQKLPQLQLELEPLGWGATLEPEVLIEPFTIMGLDGQSHACRALKLIGDCLYLAGIAHSCGRGLPRQSELRSQFYLPKCRVYIELWGLQLSPSDLTQQLARQAYFTEHQHQLISLQLTDMQHLDDYLSKALLNFDVKAYSA